MEFKEKKFFRKEKKESVFFFLYGEMKGNKESMQTMYIRFDKNESYFKKDEAQLEGKYAVCL